MKKLIAKLLIILSVFSGFPQSTLAKTDPANELTASLLSASCCYRIPAKSVQTHRIYFNAGHYHITIDGDNSTDLDLFIYDRDGLFFKGTGQRDYETASIDVCCSGYLTIKVKNLGRIYNDYRLTIE